MLGDKRLTKELHQVGDVVYLRGEKLRPPARCAAAPPAWAPQARAASTSRTMVIVVAVGGARTHGRRRRIVGVAPFHGVRQ